MNALASALIAVGLALLDRRLDGWIDGSKLSPAGKAELKEREDELIAALRVVLKAASPRIVRLLGKAIPNDPSTGTWA